LLDAAGQRVSHLRKMHVLGLVKAADKPRQIAMSGRAHWRKRLAKKSINPMLKVKAVGHRSARLQEKGGLPSTCQSAADERNSLFYVNPKLSGS